MYRSSDPRCLQNDQAARPVQFLTGSCLTGFTGRRTDKMRSIFYNKMGWEMGDGSYESALDEKTTRISLLLEMVWRVVVLV